MSRIVLIPVFTGNGREVALQAVVLRPGDRLRRLVERLRGRRRRR
jgi:hypothetical protein